MAMAPDTRWVSIPQEGEGWVLAYRYIDRRAGPSAKGGLVREPVTLEQIRSAVESPDRTFRNPKKFGAMPISAEDALRLGLPEEPPWIGVFEPRPAPPPGMDPSHAVTAVVTCGGAPVAGARVRLGRLFGEPEQFTMLEERTTDPSGRCSFREMPVPPARAIAAAPGVSSRVVAVPAGGVVDLDLRPVGALEGTTTKRGAPVVAHIRIRSRDGLLRLAYADAVGRYRIDDGVPGTYDVDVYGVDPRTHMDAGTPTCDVIEIREGETLRRDYALAAGVEVHVSIAAEGRGAHWASVYLFRGSVAPRTSLDVRALWRSRSEGEYQSANALSKDKEGRYITTYFADVLPGMHTLCVNATAHGSEVHEEQPVVCRDITVAAEPISVAIDLPPLRRAWEHSRVHGDVPIPSTDGPSPGPPSSGRFR